MASFLQASECTRKILSIDIGMRNLGLSLISCDVTNCNILLPIPWSCVQVSHFEVIDILQDDDDTKTHNTQESLDNKIDITIRELPENDTGKKTKKRKSNAREINIHDACRRTIDALFRRTWMFDGLTDIRVEQQPFSRGFAGGGGGSSGSVRMKIMQHCILTFFETYFLLRKPPHPIRIEAASPTNKLKCVIVQDDVATKPLTASAKGTDYKTRKAQAVIGFDHMIEWCDIAPELKAKYQAMKKQNDIADSALQALYEIQVYLCKVRQKATSKKAQADRRGTKRKATTTITPNSNPTANLTANSKKRRLV